MITLLSVKRYELRTNKVFFIQVRPGLGAFFSGALLWLEYVLPALAAYQARRLYALLRAWLRAGVAWVILATETLLERTLHVLRRKTEVPRHGEASPFLREVAEHKKKLLQDRSEE
jgi:hypothetical protein